MARPSGELTRCGNRWTESRFNSFIKSLLRSGTRRWGPISDVKREARTGRGFYKCGGCGEVVTATIKVEGKRVNNAVVDHIEPIINPETGFKTWDEVIECQGWVQEKYEEHCRNAIKTYESFLEKGVAPELRSVS